MQFPNVAEFLSSLLPGSHRASASSAYPSPENPNVDLNDPENWDLFRGGSKTDTGLVVGPEDALRFGPVYQCLEVKSCDVATSTLHIHKINPEPGEDDIDRNQSAERVCSCEWNEATPANEGWQNLVFHQQLFGHGFAYIAREGGRINGRIQWMANLPPYSTTPRFDDELGLYYTVKIDGKEEILYRWEVFHLKGLAFEQHRALSLLPLMRNELGLALGAKLYLSKFFERGGHHGGILTVPSGMPDQARENLEQGVQKRADPKHWFKTLILRDGAEWKSSTVDPRQADMSKLTEDEARAVCHFFNVPPYKIGLRNSESYNSAEQAAKNYITGSLLHTCTRIQGECKIKLTSERVRRAGSHEFRHNFSKLLEPDVKTLNEVLEIQRRNEIINADEWRRKIRLPARSDARSKEYYNPNTKSDKTGDHTDSTADATDGDMSASGSRGTVNAEAFDDLLREAFQRACRRIFAAVRNKAKRPKDLIPWVDSFGAEHREIIPEELSASFSVVYGSSGGVKTAAAETWMLRSICSGVGQYLVPPHVESSLAQNVESFAAEWTSTAFLKWKEFSNAQ